MKHWSLLTVMSGFLAFTLAFNWANQGLFAHEIDASLHTAIDGSVSQQAIPGLPSPTTPQVEPGGELFQNQTQKRMNFLNRIKTELTQVQRDYVNMEGTVHSTENHLVELKSEALTLSNQLDNFDEQIMNTSMLVDNVSIQITNKEQEISELDQQIHVKNLEIENQKQLLAEYLGILYQQESELIDTTSEGEFVNIAKILLSDRSPGEILRERKYFSLLEETGHEIFDRLGQLVEEQEIDQQKLEDSRNKLVMLQRQLSDEQINLNVQREAKSQLFGETKGQEVIYQQLLEESKQEQEQTLNDIKALRDNLSFIQIKISELGGKFNPDDYKSLFQEDFTSVYDFIESTKNETNFSLRWPVSASRGVSAYFHDESYRKVFGVPHNAIDIRVPQGSQIHAPADGVIYKTRDNGYGYSYIILAHGGGFMSVFGHVSEIDVEPGQKIVEGQVIGLSGATPGTKGAGVMTTGAHLHFEVLKDGKHVDPLDYLPLSYLPLDSLPAKYLSRITGDQYKVRRSDSDPTPTYTTQELIQLIEKNGLLETDNDH